MTVSEEKCHPLGFIFGMLTKHYVGAVSDRLKHLDIERYWFVIMCISQQAKPVTQKELGSLINHDKTYVVRIVDYLAKKGYVVRKQNPIDRREYFIELTPLAVKALPDIKEAFDSINKSALKDLNDEQLECLQHSLKTIDNNLQRLPSSNVNINYIKNKK